MERFIPRTLIAVAEGFTQQGKQNLQQLSQIFGKSEVHLQGKLCPKFLTHSSCSQICSLWKLYWYHKLQCSMGKKINTFKIFKWQCYCLCFSRIWNILASPEMFFVSKCFVSIKKQVFMTRFICPALLNPSLGRSTKLKNGEGRFFKEKNWDYWKILSNCSSNPSCTGGGSNYIFVDLQKKKIIIVKAVFRLEFQ